FAFVQMSDASGTYEVTLFSEMLREARGLLDSGQPLVVTVDVRSEEESLRLTVQKIEPLDTVVAGAAAGLRVFVGEARALSNLKSVIAREAGGRGRISLLPHPPPPPGRAPLPRGLPGRPPTRGGPQTQGRRKIAPRHYRRARYLRRLQGGGSHHFVLCAISRSTRVCSCSRQSCGFDVVPILASPKASGSNSEIDDTVMPLNSPLQHNLRT